MCGMRRLGLRRETRMQTVSERDRRRAREMSDVRVANETESMHEIQKRYTCLVPSLIRDALSLSSQASGCAAAPTSEMPRPRHQGKARQG